jgi:hypothetical protein
MCRVIPQGRAPRLARPAVCLCASVAQVLFATRPGPAAQQHGTPLLFPGAQRGAAAAGEAAHAAPVLAHDCATPDLLAMSGVSGLAFHAPASGAEPTPTSHAPAAGEEAAGWPLAEPLWRAAGMAVEVEGAAFEGPFVEPEACASPVQRLSARASGKVAGGGVSGDAPEDSLDVLRLSSLGNWSRVAKPRG